VHGASESAKVILQQRPNAEQGSLPVVWDPLAAGGRGPLANIASRYNVSPNATFHVKETAALSEHSVVVEIPKTPISGLLRGLDLGKSVAEFDEALETYFVETDAFRQLITDKIDIVAGDKGTGKTAIYRILQKTYTNIPTLDTTEVIAAFNPTGNPVFQKLGEHQLQAEGEYIRFWKIYFLSLVGNWLLGVWAGNFTPSMTQLDQLLKGLDIRDKDDAAAHLFSMILSKICRLFQWRSAAIEISSTETGFPVVTPRIEFDNTRDSPESSQKNVNVEFTLQLLNTCLAEAQISVWVAVDRLDEAFQGFPQLEIPALRGLLRTYLDMLDFPKIRLKLFLRRDLFRRITFGGFVNLTHVNARKYEIIWDEEDLLNLLCRRIGENRAFCLALGISDVTNKEVFEKVFPRQVDVGKRKPLTWTWIMNRIRDANDIKPPRNLIDLISMAKQAQLRREERDSRTYDKGAAIIEGDAFRRALGQLSRQRVQDTLLAEAGLYAPLIERFRDGKAEHNTASLAALLEVEQGAVRSRIQPLMDIGFLEGIKDTYKVPTLYREGRNITQGKAFDANSDADEEEEV
jgi:hypothetical protein